MLDDTRNETEPENTACCNDMADYFFNCGKYDKAEEYYGMVAGTGGHSDIRWAGPSWYFCRYMGSGDALNLECLAAYAAAEPDNERAAWLCDLARSSLQTPYVDYLPVRPDASAPEPSLEPVLIHDAEPTVGQPTDRATASVKELASEPFSLRGWYDRAANLVDGMTAGDEKGLYALMVYPPLPEGTLPAGEWLMRVQYAAVCLLARLGSQFISPDEMKQYNGAFASPELVRICLGQLDRPVIPALTLLAWQITEGITDREAGLSLLDRLSERVAEHGDCFFEHALVCALSWIPGYDDSFYIKMWKRRRELECV